MRKLWGSRKYIRPFEGNLEADVSPSENEFDNPALWEQTFSSLSLPCVPLARSMRPLPRMLELVAGFTCHVLRAGAMQVREWGGGLPCSGWCWPRQQQRQSMALTTCALPHLLSAGPVVSQSCSQEEARHREGWCPRSQGEFRGSGQQGPLLSMVHA